MVKVTLKTFKKPDMALGNQNQTEMIGSVLCDFGFSNVIFVIRTNETISCEKWLVDLENAFMLTLQS